jgi:hypothetical protein
MMMNHFIQNNLDSTTRKKSPPTQKHPLSPLPDVREELQLLMESFQKFYGLSDEETESAITALKEKGYTPFVLQDKSLDVGRIGELTGLNEGAVLGLRQFAGNWVERQEAKRTRYN